TPRAGNGPGPSAATTLRPSTSSSTRGKPSGLELPEASGKQLSRWEPRSPPRPGWRDLAGRFLACPTPAPSPPPTNSAPEPADGRRPDLVGPTSLAPPLAPGSLSACHGVHRPPGPRA